MLWHSAKANTECNFLLLASVYRPMGMIISLGAVWRSAYPSLWYCVENEYLSRSEGYLNDRVGDTLSPQPLCTKETTSPPILPQTKPSSFAPQTGHY